MPEYNAPKVKVGWKLTVLNIATIVTACVTVGVILKAHANLPERTSKLELDVVELRKEFKFAIDELKKEITDNRDEKLIFQGEVKASLATIIANQAAQKDLLDRHMAQK